MVENMGIDSVISHYICSTPLVTACTSHAFQLLVVLICRLNFVTLNKLVPFHFTDLNTNFHPHNRYFTRRSTYKA